MSLNNYSCFDVSYPIFPGSALNTPLFRQVDNEVVEPASSYLNYDNKVTQVSNLLFQEVEKLPPLFEQVDEDSVWPAYSSLHDDNKVSQVSSLVFDVLPNYSLPCAMPMNFYKDQDLFWLDMDSARANSPQLSCEGTSDAMERTQIYAEQMLLSEQQECGSFQSSSTSTSERRSKLWSHREDALLRNGVAQFGERRWVEIAGLVGRTNVQCRQRWHMVLKRK